MWGTPSSARAALPSGDSHRKERYPIKQLPMSRAEAASTIFSAMRAQSIAAIGALGSPERMIRVGA